MSELNSIEKIALEKALTGSEEWKVILKSQISGLYVTKRTDTIVGGYTDFCLKGDFKQAVINVKECGNSYPPNANISHPDLVDGGSYTVWAKDGQISSLEFYTFGDENWPPCKNDEDLKKFIFE